MSIFDGIAKIISEGIDKVVPDANVRLEAKTKLAELEKNGELQELHDYLDLLKTEAASDDNYTRRARPTALYVIYILLCWGLLCSVISIFSPGKSAEMLNIFNTFFTRLPDNFYTLLETLFGIYAGARTIEKFPNVVSSAKNMLGKK